MKIVSQAQFKNAKSAGGLYKIARNGSAYAIGRCDKQGFHVRRVVWGRLLAREEKRDGETVRKAAIFVRLTGRMK
jgi:hypothetical protein